MIAAFCIVSALAANPGPEPKWMLLNREAEELRLLNRHEAAVERRALALVEAGKLGPDELPAAIIINNIGYHSQQLGQIREAARMYVRSLDILQRKCPSGDHDVIELVMNLSGAYLETNQISRAESLLRHFLGIVGLLPPDRAALLADLGSVLFRQGNLAESESLFTEALAIFEKTGPTGSAS